MWGVSVEDSRWADADSSDERLRVSSIVRVWMKRRICNESALACQSREVVVFQTALVIQTQKTCESGDGRPIGHMTHMIGEPYLIVLT